MDNSTVAATAGTADVCVVIPTRNRPDLVLRAVSSALAQRLSPAEVLVVVDGPDEATETALAGVDDPRLRVLPLPRSGGAAGARNAGVRATGREWIAFLDDDDEWSVDKLERQFRHVRENGVEGPVVYATGVEWRTDDFTFHYPRRSPRPGERVADYLFVRAHPGEGMLAVPTLLLRRELALAHPIPEHLRTHEEYDWFLDLDRNGCSFSVALEPLTTVHAPAVRSSVSTDAGWQSSLAWALARRAELGERAFSSFCLTDVARSARRAGGPRLFAAVLGMAVTARPLPRDVARFLVIWFVPQELRWRLSNRRRRRVA
ncbi:glycosyltransferase family 2 protein [Geodermatophilus sp. CPCC 205761]|uniref:glycosyltransferase family 2 protein n=1 Tax=Geodermatophilus sp. CPCC 205761 TaxID=2936597 RepID=UPI003F5375CD